MALGRPPRDALIASVANARAWEIQIERDRWLVESLANRTSYLTARGITGWFARAFKAMSKP